MSEPLRFPAPRDRDRRFDLAEFGDLTLEHLDGEEGRVARQIGLDLVLESDFETFGDVLDAVESAGPEVRRQLVDRARSELGLQTIAEQQAASALEVRRRALRPGPDRDGRRLVGCAAPGCRTVPIGPDGTMQPVADRVWWCAEHRDQAGPEDHLPPEVRYAVGPHFEAIPIGAEAERLELEEAKRREAEAARRAERRAAAERLNQIEDEHRRTLKPPAGFGE